MLEGKSMPSDMAANTNHTTLLKNQSTINNLCVLQNFDISKISKIATHCLRGALVM